MKPRKDAKKFYSLYTRFVVNAPRRTVAFHFASASDSQSWRRPAAVTVACSKAIPRSFECGSRTRHPMTAHTGAGACRKWLALKCRPQHCILRTPGELTIDTKFRHGTDRCWTYVIDLSSRHSVSQRCSYDGVSRGRSRQSGGIRRPHARIAPTFSNHSSALFSTLPLPRQQSLSGDRRVSNAVRPLLACSKNGRSVGRYLGKFGSARRFLAEFFFNTSASMRDLNPSGRKFH